MTTPALLPLPDIRFGYFRQWETYNPGLLKSFRNLKDAPQTRRSHFLAGRYENIYIARQEIPAIKPLLQRAQAYAASVLAWQEQQLCCGFWFNEMEPGQITTLHCHEEDDELLSGVYYLAAPQDSGDLLLAAPHGEVRVHPEPGLFVFFSPGIPHEVTRNQSAESRISVAFNFGPAEQTSSAD